MRASTCRLVFQITLKASHLDETQNRASPLAFAFTLAVSSATWRSPGRAVADENPALVCLSGLAGISLLCTCLQDSEYPFFQLWHAPASSVEFKVQRRSRRNTSPESYANYDGSRFQGAAHQSVAEMNVLSDIRIELINTMKTFLKNCFLEKNIAFNSGIYSCYTKGEKAKSQGWNFSGGKDWSFQRGLVLLLGGGKHETHPSPAGSSLRSANQADLGGGCTSKPW